LEGVDEGRLLKALNADFAGLQSVLIQFVNEHGPKAGKAKAELHLKLSIECQDANDGVFVVKGAISRKVPSRPACVTTTMANVDEDGHAALWARRSGSTKDRPEQHVLCTQDGRSVDPETGEARTHDEKKWPIEIPDEALE
jgi:hypothetical protein